VSNPKRRGTTPAASGLFAPILPGATLRGRLIGAAGALLAISLTALVTSLVVGDPLDTALIVAPMGASAVLLFAVPASPLAQPWPVIGGNVLSAAVGVAMLQLVPNEVIAAGLAVGLAIALMSLARCLHPPGGAAALLAVVGGPDVTDAGFAFALLPVGVNAALMTLAAIAFNRLAGKTYPQASAAAPPPNPVGTSDLPPTARIGFRAEDIDRAIADSGEAYDISRDDLTGLLRRVERSALDRTHGRLTAADIMSGDVVSVTTATPIEEARKLLLERRVRTLPVVDATGRVRGHVGLREVAANGASAADVMSKAVTIAPGDSVLDLVPAMTEAHNHAAIVVDDRGQLLGLVTQTDLLVALARTPPLDQPIGER